MYELHTVFNPPADPNQKIWRYMEFSKFVSLISTSKLYFGAADKMVDRFEGSYSRANINFRKEFYGEVPLDFQRQLSDHARNSRQYTYLNCWHMSDYESAAMWGLYQAEGRGVAIRSTFNNFKDCFKTPQRIYIGTVSYADYKEDVIPENNDYYRFVHKRRSFVHEREIRALISDPNYLNAPDIPKIDFTNNVPVDLSLLINAVHVAPDSPDWFFKAAQSVAEKYNLTAPVKQSALDKDPIF